MIIVFSSVKPSSVKVGYVQEEEVGFLYFYPHLKIYSSKFQT